VGPGIAEQTEQVFANLRAILEAAGSGLDRLVKTTVFLKDLADFAGMNEVYKKHAGDLPPARSTVQVAAIPAWRPRRDRGYRAPLSKC
jgi:2-iminobutanoate/2-iminopropanoate deaminase